MTTTDSERAVRWLVVVEETFVPADSGGRAETLNLLLAARDAGVRLHVVVPGPADVDQHVRALEGRVDAGAPDDVEPPVRVTVVPRRTGLLSHLSLSPYVFASRPLPAGLADRLRGAPYDLVVAQSFRVAHLGIALARDLGLPLVVRPHNMESEYFRELARSAPLRLRAPFLVESLKLRLAERRVHRCPSVTAFADLSAQDAQRRARRTRTRVVHLPPPLPAAPLAPRRAPERDAVLFVGSLDNVHNSEAVRWLVDAVWPLVLLRRPGARLHVVGRRAPGRVRALVEGAGGRLTSDAPSTASHLARAAVFVNPVHQGSGVNMKVVDAMRAGVPVVSTWTGGRGLDWRPGRDLLLADRPEEFAAAVAGLLEDDVQRTRLGAAGQRYVRERLDGARAVAQLHDLALGSPGVPAPGATGSHTRVPA